jgi:UDP-glucose:glycoprotein glucosyltransferase
VDPASADARSVLKTVFSLYAHNVPLRIGLIFVVDDSPNANGKNDVGVALYNIFQFVKTEKSPAKAAHFLQQVQ